MHQLGIRIPRCKYSPSSTISNSLTLFPIQDIELYNRVPNNLQAIYRKNTAILDSEPLTVPSYSTRGLFGAIDHRDIFHCISPMEFISHPKRFKHTHVEIHSCNKNDTADFIRWIIGGYAFGYLLGLLSTLLTGMIVHRSYASIVSDGEEDSEDD